MVFKIASLNIASLRKYKDELGIILNDNEIDVMLEKIVLLEKSLMTRM